VAKARRGERPAARENREAAMTTIKYLQVFIFAMAAFFMWDAAPLLAQRSAADNHISYYQQLLKRNPQSATAYHGLGDALIRKARETGDSTYFNRAEEALKKSLDIMPQNAGALRHLAYVFYSRHEFTPAAVHARKAVEMNPADADSYGVLGDALLEVGQYLEADAAYKIMIELDKSLYSYSRLAGLKSMRGENAGAIDDLERAIAIGKAEKQPAESVAWTEWQLGAEYFAVGDLEKAEASYRRSLANYSNYYRALTGLAQLRAAQQRYDEAITFYKNAIGIIPMPEYIAALGDVYTKVGKLDEARSQYELVEYIGKLSAINRVMYNRELAYFYADHDMKPLEGLELAKRELEYRKDIYAYDVVAWNLFRNSQFEKAAEAINQALKLGTKDAKLFYHAGMIFDRLGDQRKAKDYLGRALATNPYFHVLFADRAVQMLRELENSDATAAGQPSEGQ
jgi:tetratricopeptide (TPR) repeat protein